MELEESHICSDGLKLLSISFLIYELFSVTEVVDIDTIFLFTVEKRPKPDDRLNTLREESMEVSQSAQSSSADADNKTEAGKKMQTESAEPIADPEPIAGPSHQASAGQGQRKPPSELPFQLQVVYTDTEGAKAMRLLTKTKPVTKDRFQAERGEKIF